MTSEGCSDGAWDDVDVGLEPWLSFAGVTDDKVGCC